MKNEKHPLDEFFREGLDEHKIQPSSKVWSRIEEAHPKPEQKRSGWVMLRASVVVLLIGLGTFFYLQREDVANNVVTGPEHNEVVGPEKGTSEQKQNKSTEENKGAAESPKEEVKPRKKAVPIMRQSTSRPIYVSNDEVLKPVNEEALVAENQEANFENVLVQLKEETQEPAPIKLRVRVKPKAATKGFYANNDKKEDEPKPAFKDRVQTYASSQMDNLLNGKPLEWPKMESKPQLEIPLPRILSN